MKFVTMCVLEVFNDRGHAYNLKYKKVSWGRLEAYVVNKEGVCDICMDAYIIGMPRSQNT